MKPVLWDIEGNYEERDEKKQREKTELPHYIVFEGAVFMFIHPIYLPSAHSRLHPIISLSVFLGLAHEESDRSIR